MQIFRVKARSWEAYVAAIGASGVLMASGIVIFVILVGVVTFKTWPDAGGLLGGGGRDVTLHDTATPAPRHGGAQPSALNVVKVLGGGSAASTYPGGGSGGIRKGPASGGSVESPGGSLGPPGGSGGGSPQGAQPPPGSTPSPNPVARAVSGVGDTVQADTDSLGDTLGGNSSPGLGGLVGGVGRSVNSDLQSLAGNQ
jgi:hypothetical protein